LFTDNANNRSSSGAIDKALSVALGEGDEMNTVQDTTNTTTNNAPTSQPHDAWYAASNGGGPASAQTAANGPRLESQGSAALRRMLYRSPSDKLVGGVCGGIAEYLGWNPVLVRVGWVVATFATWGGGILAYILLALFLPTGTNTVGQIKPPALELSQKGMSWAAGLLIGLGGLWLLANLGILPGMWRGFWGLVGVIFWPALLIGAGYLLLRANSEKDIDQEIKNTASNMANKVKGTFDGKLPSGEQVKGGFSSMRSSLPLRRSSTNKILLGVCGGLGEKFGIDANLIRLIWAAFALGTMGTGALVYLVAGLLLPSGAQLPAASSMGGENAQNITIVDGSAEPRG
jgi:phage shock protein PspC (stress-responsive transcriptional regulator)